MSYFGLGVAFLISTSFLKIGLKFLPKTVLFFVLLIMYEILYVEPCLNFSNPVWTINASRYEPTVLSYGLSNPWPKVQSFCKFDFSRFKKYGIWMKWFVKFNYCCLDIVSVEPGWTANPSH